MLQPDRRCRAALNLGRKPNSRQTGLRARSHSQERHAVKENDSPPVVAGIDVSKDRLDVHLWPSGQNLSLDNTGAGAVELVERLRPHGATLVVIEATGRYERRAALALMDAGYEVAVVNPRQPRDFAKASGQLAKTDAIDARILAQFGAVIGPRPSERPAENRLILDELVARRRQLVEMITMERNRIEHALHLRLRRQIEHVVKALDKQLVQIEAEILDLIDRDDDWRRRFDVLKSAPASATPRPPRSWPSCRSWAASVVRPSLRWWAWRPSIATAERSADNVTSPAAGTVYAECCTWPRSRRGVGIPRSRHSPSGSPPPANPLRSS